MRETLMIYNSLWHLIALLYSLFVDNNFIYDSYFAVICRFPKCCHFRNNLAVYNLFLHLGEI